MVQHFRDHQHFVQGVAWSPSGDMVATQSCDRSVIVYKRSEASQGSMFTCLTTNTKLARRPHPEKLYVDEMRTTYFRRLTFSPDGALLITPAGRYLNEAGQECSTLYIFRTSAPSTPILRLQGIESTVVATRCCPQLFTRSASSAIFTGYGKRKGKRKRSKEICKRATHYTKQLPKERKKERKKERRRRGSTS